MIMNDSVLHAVATGPDGVLAGAAPILKERCFEAPPSDIDTAAKDVDLILDTARRDAVPLPLTAAARQMMAAAQARDDGRRDIYSVLEAFEAITGLKIDR